VGLGLLGFGLPDRSTEVPESFDGPLSIRSRQIEVDRQVTFGPLRLLVEQ
jgi:hypothetical protein